MRPTVGSYAEAAYQAVSPLTYADEGLGWPLLSLLGAIGSLFQEIDDISRDTPSAPGWSAVLDIDRAPADALAWLGQFVGVTLPTGIDPVRQRQTVRAAAGFARGTPAAIRAAAEPLLTGNRTVRIYERDSSAYHLTVITYTSETPYPTETEAAIRAQKPAGLILDYAVRDGQEWETVKENNATWQDVKDNYVTWQGVRDAVPSL